MSACFPGTFQSLFSMAGQGRPPSGEFEFVSKEINKDYFCPVSLEVMMNPHQTDCCGSHICARVAERMTGTKSACPMCKAPCPSAHTRNGEKVFTTHRDQYFQRIILDQRVLCPHRKNGCEWTGPLREVQDHSASCGYRPWICQHCRYSTIYKVGTTEHAQKCPLRPIICPCSSQPVPYNKLEEHKKTCPVELISCEFTDVGCNVKIRRKNMMDHLSSCAWQHQLLMSRKTLNVLQASPGPSRPTLEESSRRFKEKDAKISELKDKVITLSADLNATREQLIGLRVEMQEKHSEEVGELLGELKKKNDNDLHIQRLKEQIQSQEEQLQNLQYKGRREFDTEVMLSNVGVMVTDIVENLRSKKTLNERDLRKLVGSLEEVMVTATERSNGEDAVSVEGYVVASSPVNLPGNKVVKFRGHLEKTAISGLKRAWGITAVGEDIYVVDTNGSYGIHVISENSVRDLIESASFSDVHIPYGKCWYPRCVALDKAGNLYLADTGSHRILKYSSSGKPLVQAGRESTPGNSSRAFDCPIGIALDANENVYVCDRSNHRIQVLTSELKLVSSFGTKGNGVAQFLNPWDLAFDQEGFIYVADCGNRCIKVFKPDLSPFKVLGKSDGRKYKDGDLRAPSSVCVDEKGNVYVTDTGLKTVVVYNSAGEYSMNFGQFVQPYGVCVDSKGRVYVSDNGGYTNMFSTKHPGRVQVFI